MTFTSVLLGFALAVSALGAQSQSRGVAFNASADHHTSLVDGYRVYLLRDGQALRTREFAKTEPDAEGSIRYIDPTLFDGLDAGTYEIGVTAYGAGGESVMNDRVSFTIGTPSVDQPAPPEPTDSSSPPPTTGSTIGTPPSAGTAPSPGSCTTVKPGPDWICHAGGWLPPGMPVPGVAPPPLPSVATTTTGCSTAWPGAGWSCVNGGWYPPGHPIAAAPAVAVPPATTPSTACLTIRPGPLWTCVNGGWYPPDAAPVGASGWIVHVEAEDFDQGRQGEAYYDASPGNSGGAYRTSEVDIEVARDAGGGLNVGWIAAGEWLNFTVTVPVAGIYDLEIRVASKGPGGAFHLEFDGVDRTGLLGIPDTGGWQIWSTVRATVQLQAGTQVWRFVADTQSIETAAAGNLNWIRATPR